MLGAIGVDSLEALFADIPESVRLDRELELPLGRSEQEVYEHLAALAGRNRSTEEEITFVGAGMYDHYVPALIDTLLGRSEFLTPYTPYQPEISQGGLQVMFEFQTAISELHGPAGGERLGVRGAERRGGGRLPGEARDAPHEARGEPRPPPTLARRAGHARGGLRHAGGRGAARRRRRDRRRGARRGGGRRHRRGVRAAAELSRDGGGRGRAGRGRQAHRRAARVRRRPDTRSAFSSRRASSGPTSAWARGSRSGTGSTSAGRRSASSPPTTASSARCRAGSRARRATSTGGAGSCSRSRRASSTSAVRRPPTTSAPRRR